MLLGDGQFQALPVLSPARVAEMFADQTFGAVVEESPEPGYGYGLGTWRELVAADGTPLRVSSPGAFGYTPWIDLEYGFYGIYMVQYSRAALKDEINAVVGEARVAIAEGGCGLQGDGDCDDDTDLDDLLVTLGSFGTLLAGPADGDTDGNQLVNLDDLLTVLSEVGAVCEIE
jgi:CubicO group peptidase (beta-lactamase class C family)